MQSAAEAFTVKPCRPADDPREKKERQPRKRRRVKQRRSLDNAPHVTTAILASRALGNLTQEGYEPPLTTAILASRALGDLTQEGFEPPMTTAILASRALGELTQEEFKPPVTTAILASRALGDLTQEGSEPPMTTAILASRALGDLTQEGFEPPMTTAILASRALPDDIMEDDGFGSALNGRVRIIGNAADSTRAVTLTRLISSDLSDYIQLASAFGTQPHTMGKFQPKASDLSEALKKHGHQVRDDDVSMGVPARAFCEEIDRKNGRDPSLRSHVPYMSLWHIERAKARRAESFPDVAAMKKFSDLEYDDRCILASTAFVWTALFPNGSSQTIMDFARAVDASIDRHLLRAVHGFAKRFRV